MLRRATMEKFDFNSCEVSQPVPYLFLTPKGQEIDLRLFCRDIMRKALPVLVGILERETRGWFLHFRERLIAELRAKKLTDKEIEEEVNEAVMKEYLQRVYSSIMSNAKLAELGNGVSQLLVEQAQSVVIMYKAVDKVQQDIKRTREDHQKCLANDHSVLSRVAPWLRSKLRHAEQHKLYKCAWSAHEEALKMCSQHNLHQTAYFLSRDLAFMKEREPVLLKELKNAKTPTRSFQWACRIWSPQSWIIRRNFQGQSDVIPTVISQQATSIVTPRSDPSQPVFLVEKEMIRTTSTRWPFWRLLNLLQRTWCWTWNMMFLLGILVPWCSPLGLRALFCIKPFMPDLELSQINGTLFPRKTSITQTLASRLIELWRHISKSRTHFETEPDTGERPLYLVLRTICNLYQYSCRLHWQRLDTQFESNLELLCQRLSGHHCHSVCIPTDMLGDMFPQHWAGIERTALDSSVCSPVAHLHDTRLWFGRPGQHSKSLLYSAGGAYMEFSYSGLTATAGGNFGCHAALPPGGRSCADR